MVYMLGRQEEHWGPVFPHIKSVNDEDKKSTISKHVLLMCWLMAHFLGLKIDFNPVQILQLDKTNWTERLEALQILFFLLV